MLLVAARTDVGTPTLTRKTIEAFCQDYAIDGYIPTSARQDIGIAELIERINVAIPWLQLPTITSTQNFKVIKEHVLRMKASDEGHALISQRELSAELENAHGGWRFTEAEMMTAVGHLANHGYVTVIKRSSGEEVILLAPDLLGRLASSVVLEARRHERGLGLIDESQLLVGDYSFPEEAGLNPESRTALLDATVGLFLRRNLCFRETVGDRTCLVFPSLINEKRPLVNEKRPLAANASMVDDVAYKVSGEIDTVYAALVVQLGYTGLFRREHRWQHQAQYELEPGEICGFRQTMESGGDIEFVLSYTPEAAEDTRKLFQGAFERFLKRRKVRIQRVPAVICENGHLQERAVASKAIAELRPFFFCPMCGVRIVTPKIDDVGIPATRQADAVGTAEYTADSRTGYEVALSWVKAFRRDSGKLSNRPTCFLSYAWGDTRHERWVEQLADHLQHADIGVILDRWHNRPGSDIGRFIERIDASDFICVIGTPRYGKKDEIQDADPVVQAELRLIKQKLTRRDSIHETVIPVLCEGSPVEAFPPLLRGSVYIDFRDEADFFINLFSLVLTVHHVPFDEKMAREHRNKISRDRRDR